jgi:hypothetical protein
MCATCEHFKAGNLTPESALIEAGRMAGNAKTTDQAEHAVSLVDLIMSKEIPFNDTDPEMDSIYQNELNRP